MNTALTALLPKRTGGATNLRGLIFQLLFALRQALDLYEEGCEWQSVGLEQFEDVDLHLKPVQLTGITPTRYCQSKTSEGTYYPSDLEEALRGLLEVLLADPQARFELILSFSPTGQVAEIADFANLNAKRTKAMRTVFRRKCHNAAQASKSGKVPALPITDAHADTLLDRLKFRTYDEAKLEQEIKVKLGEHFGLVGPRVEEYFHVFFARFAQWSRERKRITRTDLDALRDQIEANRAFEAEFAARGQMLLRKIDWAADATPDDFFQGKATRMGHVADDLDVPRLRWIERVGAALNAVGIAVVRASSGQGKSTLALRFARDKWLPEHTFTLLSAPTETEASLVNEALRARVQTYSLPTFLLIDNANRNTAAWSSIAQEWARLGVPTLVTLRQEDWVRFAQQSLFACEVVEPSLDLSEARDIFHVLKERGHVHRDAPSAEWAFERIGEPHLLMEFVYLVTHGQMLEDRLREQLDEIERHEKPVKLEILRRVALADTLGAPVLEDRLFEDLRCEWGVEAIAAGSGTLLRSLDGEYLRRLDNTLSGLHWVRSDHLVRLLHDSYPTPTATALAVLRCVSGDHITLVVAGALTRSDINREEFMQALIERAQTAPLSELLAYLQGVFEAGEAHFFEVNKPLLDQSHDQLGQAGPFLLCMDHPPSSDKQFLSNIGGILSGDLRGMGPLLELSKRFQKVERGIDNCRRLLEAVAPRLAADVAGEDIGTTGDLMAWSGWCKVAWPGWDAAREAVLERPRCWDFPVETLCHFHEGLWLFDRAAYCEHVARDTESLRDYLQWQLDCLRLELGPVPSDPQDKDSAQGALSLEFLASDLEPAGTGAVDRLTKLYSLFPFYERYHSKAYYSLELPMAYDPSIKAMTQEFQYLRFMVACNSFWSRLVDSGYAVQTYYEFSRAWHEARHRAISTLTAVADRLEEVLAGRVLDLYATFGPANDPKALHEALLQAPSLPLQTPPDIKEKLKVIKDWNGHLSTWIGQFTSTAVFFQKHGRLPADTEDDAVHTAHLMLFNLRDAAKNLPAMQEAMRALFEVVGDALGSTSLEVAEEQAFERALAALEVWTEDRPSTPVPDLQAFLLEKRAQKWKQSSARLHSALAPLEAQGRAFLYPSGLYTEFPLTFLPLGFSVADPCDFLHERDTLLEALEPLHDEVSFGCLIPMTRDENGSWTRFLPGGYRVALRAPAPDDASDLETRAAVLFDVQELPGDVLELLPQTPLHESPRLRAKATLHRLIFEFESFARQRRRIEELASAPGPFTMRLYEQNRLRLLRQTIGQSLDFDEARTLLDQQFGEKRDSPIFEVVLGLLEMAQALREAQEQIHSDQENAGGQEDAVWMQTARLEDVDFDQWHLSVTQLS